jgi:perosamine synthetase
LIPYGRHTVDFRDAMSVAWQIRTKSLTQGPKIQEFEALVASYTGAKYAVAVSSATAGLHIALLALELPKDSSVATSPISFVASSNAALYAGLKPMFIDIDPNSLNISHKALESVCLVNPNISALIPVHFAGLSCDMEEISKVAQTFKLRVVEDAAHALGGSYPSGEKIGSCKYSDITVFSLHAVKSVTTGEGGVITTNSYDLYVKLLRLRSHGINKLQDTIQDTLIGFSDGVLNPWYYEMQELGFHYRLSEIQSTLGCSQIKKLDSFMDSRFRLTLSYDEAFSSERNIKTAQVGSKELSGNHIYPVRIRFDRIKINRAQLMAKLLDLGIGTQVHYLPIPLHPYYKKLGYLTSGIPEAMNYYSQCLTIPLFPRLSLRKQKFVIKSLKALIK